MAKARFQCNSGSKAHRKVRIKFEMLLSLDPTGCNDWFVPILLIKKGERFSRLQDTYMMNTIWIIVMKVAKFQCHKSS